MKSTVFNNNNRIQIVCTTRPVPWPLFGCIPLRANMLSLSHTLRDTCTEYRTWRIHICISIYRYISAYICLYRLDYRFMYVDEIGGRGRAWGLGESSPAEPSLSAMHNALPKKCLRNLTGIQPGEGYPRLGIDGRELWTHCKQEKYTVNGIIWHYYTI